MQKQTQAALLLNTAEMCYFQNPDRLHLWETAASFAARLLLEASASPAVLGAMPQLVLEGVLNTLIDFGK